MIVGKNRFWMLSSALWLGVGSLLAAYAGGCGAVAEVDEELLDEAEEVSFGQARQALGSSGPLVTITTLAQLRAMSTNCNCRLGANINASATQTAGQEFVPIGDIFSPFTGTFNGNGFTISNLKISRPLPWVGLFGATSNAIVTRANLTNVSVNGPGQTGGLIGVATGSEITESSVTGTVTGRASGTTIWQDVGMLIGAAWGTTTVKNSYATGTLNGALERAGGLIGSSNGNSSGNVVVRECFTNVTITTTAAASSTIVQLGGLIGRVQGTEMYEVYTVGSQTARAPAYVGGIIGEAEGNISGVGDPIIRAAFSRGAVTIPATPAVDRAGAIGHHNNWFAWCGAMWDNTVDPGSPRPDSVGCQNGVSTNALRSATVVHGPFIFGQQTTDPSLPTYPGGSDGSFDLLIWNYNSGTQHTTLKGIPDSVQPK